MQTLSLHRNSKELLERRLASQLVALPEWNNLLKPILEGYITAEAPSLLTLDSAFLVARQQGEIECAAYLIAKIERLANEFKYCVAID